MAKWLALGLGLVCAGACNRVLTRDEKLQWPTAENEPAPAVIPFDRRRARRYQQAWGHHLAHPRELTNSIGMRFVLIPAGEFLMGSPETEPNRHPDEGPQHRVRLTRPFFLGVFEVTQGEYERVIGRNPSHYSPEGRWKNRLVPGTVTAKFPVEAVSWHDAVEFCRRLSDLPQERATGRVYRLPTEAEWEFACRAGTDTPFHFGMTLTSWDANFIGKYAYGTTRRGPQLSRPADVGSYRPSNFGLYDMHGNVWEWCADWYDPHYYAESPVDDPAGPTDGEYRVIRGGGWEYGAGSCRSASRYRRTPTFRHGLLGFRVAFDVPQQEPAERNDVGRAAKEDERGDKRQ